MVTGTIPAVQALMDTEAERTFWEVVRHHERPPYFFENEGVGNRLARAARVVTDERITPNSDGSYTVTGSENRQYRVTDSCSCPQSQKGKSKHCYHMVAVALYIEWQRRLRPVAPVVLGTLRAGTMPLPHDDDDLGNGFPVDDETLPLPLPPRTVDERLAAAVDQCVTHALQEDRLPQDAGEGDLPLIAPREEGPVYTTSVGARYTLPEGANMPDDDGYIPEPARVSTAILEPPGATRAPGSRPGQALTPVAQEDDLEQALTRWTAQRQIVQRFLKHQLIAGTDYYQLRIGKGESKPSLSKAGAEKVLSWLKWSASFTPDTGTWEMLGRPTTLVCYVCHLHTRSGEVVGEGRGARSVTKDGGDINKAIKMAEKSSMVSAVLRTGALSDCFTQDIEDMQEPESLDRVSGQAAKPTTPAKPTAADLRQRIWAKVQELAPDVKTREAVEAYIKDHTGMTLHPDLYEAIATRLYEGGR